LPVVDPWDMSDPHIYGIPDGGCTTTCHSDKYGDVMRAKYRAWGYRMLHLEDGGGEYSGIGSSPCIGREAFCSCILGTIADDSLGNDGKEFVQDIEFPSNENAGEFVLLLGLDYLRAYGISVDYANSECWQTIGGITRKVQMYRVKGSAMLVIRISEFEKSWQQTAEWTNGKCPIRHEFFVLDEKWSLTAHHTGEMWKPTTKNPNSFYTKMLHVCLRQREEENRTGKCSGIPLEDLGRLADRKTITSLIWKHMRRSEEEMDTLKRRLAAPREAYVASERNPHDTWRVQEGSMTVIVKNRVKSGKIGDPANHPILVASLGLETLEQTATVKRGEKTDEWHLDQYVREWYKGKYSRLDRTRRLPSGNNERDLREKPRIPESKGSIGRHTIVLQSGEIQRNGVPYRNVA